MIPVKTSQPCLMSTEHQSQQVRNSLQVWNLRPCVPCHKQSIGFWVSESPRLCGLFSHVHVGHSLSCCFNPYAPGPCPCPCVFVLESPPAPRVLCCRTSVICIYTFSHKGIHTDRKGLWYTTVYMKKDTDISLTCFPMLQQPVTFWEIRPLWVFRSNLTHHTDKQALTSSFLPHKSAGGLMFWGKLNADVEK